MPIVSMLHVQPVSLIDHENRQAVEVFTQTDTAFHARLTAFDTTDGQEICACELGIDSGKGENRVLLPRPQKARRVRWALCSLNGELLAQSEEDWPMPREWKFYIMISSHTDIGLHNSQYHQRYYSSRFLKQALKLCDQTADRPTNDQYRYTIEGTWFWNNFPADHGERAARRVVRDYVKSGRLGVCAGVAGNHTQVYGLEELCRSTYGKQRLKQDWDIDSETMTMIDNNGLNWSLVQPYAEAGFKNIIFSPNQWNPLPSATFHQNRLVQASTWDTQARGSGARIDMSFDSALPRIFYWQSADETNRILVYSGGNYGHSGNFFGLNTNTRSDVRQIADAMAAHLPIVEERYPYDMWMMPFYQDDQEPSLALTDSMADWNGKWQWPQLRTLGHPDEMMREFREKFDGLIPTLRGDLAGGWYQHPLSTAELLAQKFAADRALPTAEKLSSLAALLDENYRYPATAFERAWNALLYNDEHSYGTSGYQGRRVYETWMQHRAWIELAEQTARDESKTALDVIASHIASSDEQVVAFNPTLQARCELIADPQDANKVCLAQLPPFGYKALPISDFQPLQITERQPQTPPVVENAYYRLTFAENGGLRSIFDKQLARELLDQHSAYAANTFVYTADNHQSFHQPQSARFKVEQNAFFLRVTAEMEEPCSGAAIVQQVTLSAHEKRIDIDNRLSHVRDLFNTNRYYRYAYYAFPFALDNARRLCHLGGCVAEYAKDVTGHCTDVYMAANEWCCVQNDEMGIGLMQLDSQLVEFDHIHPDKTDFANTGDGSQVFCYLANDWLQMHVAGGEQLNYRFRYAITSFADDYQAAGLPEAAERFANAPCATRIARQEGTLPAQKCFLSADEPVRLLTLKRAEDGQGLIARLYGGESEQLHLDTDTFGTPSVTRSTVNEQPLTDLPSKTPAFRTLRLGQYALPTREVAQPHGEGAANTPIGATFTGLIDQPRAARGERDGHLYLIWGRMMEKDLSHYELYRGLTPDFVADEQSLLACVRQDKYCVGRYVDDGLQPNTTYYYRVRAVDKQNRRGPLSEVFSGLTKQA